MTQSPFAVFDIDGTLIRWQLYHAIVDTLIEQGHLPPQTGQTIVQARNTWKHRASPDSFSHYEQTLLQAYQQRLRSIHYSHFTQAVQQVFQEHKDQVYTYTRDLIRQLKKQRYTLLAISGSQQEIVQLLGQYYGFDWCIGSRFYTNTQGFFTDKSDIPAHLGKGKLLKDLVAQHRLSWTDSYAIGDSQSDAAMLELVANPIAFNPDDKLFSIATAKQWPIVVERKNVIYRLQPQADDYRLQLKSDPLPPS